MYAMCISTYTNIFLEQIYNSIYVYTHTHQYMGLRCNFQNKLHILGGQIGQKYKTANQFPAGES